MSIFTLFNYNNNTRCYYYGKSIIILLYEIFNEGLGQFLMEHELSQVQLYFGAMVQLQPWR